MDVNLSTGQTKEMGFPKNRLEEALWKSVLFTMINFLNNFIFFIM